LYPAINTLEYLLCRKLASQGSSIELVVGLRSLNSSHGNGSNASTPRIVARLWRQAKFQQSRKSKGAF